MELVSETRLREYLPEAPDLTLKVWKDVEFSHIKPHPDNPTIHDDDLLDMSFGAFGFANMSLTVDENWVLIGGHGSMNALERKGYKSVPYVFQVIGFLDEDTKMQLRMVLNKSTMRASMDQDMVSKILSGMAERGLKDRLELTGYNTAELAVLVREGAEKVQAAIREASSNQIHDDSVGIIAPTLEKGAARDWSPFADRPVEFPPDAEIPKSTSITDLGEVQAAAQPNTAPYMLFFLFGNQEEAEAFLGQLGIAETFGNRRSIQIDMRPHEEEVPQEEEENEEDDEDGTAKQES